MSEEEANDAEDGMEAIELIFMTRLSSGSSTNDLRIAEYDRLPLLRSSLRRELREDLKMTTVRKSLGLMEL